MYYAGVDIGSTTSKAVITDGEGRLLTFYLGDTLPDRDESGRRALTQAQTQLGITRADIAFITATGYGRKAFTGADSELPEIICHAAGTRKLIPGTGTIIDIGGQDSKVIQLGENGNVVGFEMNDKCAAGTGRFFEVLSERLLSVPIAALSDMALAADDACQISSMCTIFAESEIVSCMSRGVSREAIAAGMCRAVAKRIVQMAKSGQVEFKDKLVFSGGAANNEALRRAVAETAGMQVISLDNPQCPAAYGAALMAGRQYRMQSLGKTL